MSDDKKRVISRSQNGAPSEPHLVGNEIVFFCPNGHKLKVPVTIAGKRGLCTKCKVPVVIPMVRKPVGPAVGPPPEAWGGLPEAEAGGEQSEPDAAGPEEGSGAVSPAPAEEEPAAPAEEWNLMTDVEPAPAALGFDVGQSSVGVESAWPSVQPAADAGDGADHPAARLVARLWVERGHGGVVELHLAGGSVILPEWYEPNWSRGTHGLFASQAVDGSVTLTAVAWDTVEKIVVRQIQGLPDGMFE